MTESIARAIHNRDLDRLRRYREYLDYYEGRRGAPAPRLRERTLTFNYARTVVEKGASYLVTDHAPTTVAADNRAESRRRAAEAQRELLDVWQDNDIARLDLETEVDTAVLGDGAFKIAWDGVAKRVVVAAPDVQGLYAWWAGDDVRRLTRVASRYRLPVDEAVLRFGHDVRPCHLPPCDAERELRRIIRQLLRHFRPGRRLERRRRGHHLAFMAAPRLPSIAQP